MRFDKMRFGETRFGEMSFGERRGHLETFYTFTIQIGGRRHLVFWKFCIFAPRNRYRLMLGVPS